MLTIDDPPPIAACASCMKPLTWLYSARTSRWVPFVAHGGSDIITVHRCGEAASWRHATPQAA